MKNVTNWLIISIFIILFNNFIFAQAPDNNPLMGQRDPIKKSNGTVKERTKIQMIEDPDDTDRAENEMSFDGFPKRNFTFVFNYPIYTTYAGTISMESAMMIAVKGTNYPITFAYKKAGSFIQVITYFAKSILVDIPIIHAGTTFNHEFFGHAARVREAGGTVDKVHIDPPFPFGSGGGYMQYHGVDSTDHTLMIISGGYEANTLMSHIIAKRWVKDGYIAPHDFTTYFITRMDLFYYIYYTDNLSSSKDGNDISNYVIKVNEKYGYTTGSQYKLTLDKLHKYQWFILADPFLYLAAASHFYTQITGRKYMQTYMIPLGRGLSFLPAMRLALAPYGPEWYADIFFKFEKTIVVIPYFRMSTGEFKNAWGFGIKFTGIYIAEQFELGGAFHIFSQPELTHSSTPGAGSDAEMFIGFAAYLDITLKLTELFRLTTRMGYKTNGYVFGHPLESEIIWHFGSIFHF